MDQAYQTQYETQTTEHASIYRFKNSKITLTHNVNSKMLLSHRWKQMIIHLPNWFNGIHNISNSDPQQTTMNQNTQPTRKENNSNYVQNTELTNNSCGIHNLNLLKIQISEVINAWYSIHVQTFAKETQTEEELIQN